MGDTFEIILIFTAVLIGVISATYFYLSAGIFVTALGRPLKLVSLGMMIIAIGVLLAATISFEARYGINFILYGLPLQAVFYLLYIIGSLLILVGARKFTYRPKVKAK